MTANTSMLLGLSTNKPNYKKGFSLLEIVFVVLIIGSILVAGSNLFISNNQIFVRSERCVQELYNSAILFLDQGAKGKSIASGGTIIYPETYTVGIKPSQQKMILSYDSGSIFSRYLITGNSLCLSNTHYLQLTGTDNTIKITHQSQGVVSSAGVLLEENNQKTDKNIIKNTINRCRKKESGDECYPFYKLLFDKRIQRISDNKCLLFREECLQRENENF